MNSRLLHILGWALAAATILVPVRPARAQATQPATQSAAGVRGFIGQNLTYLTDFEPASRAYINCVKTSREPERVAGGVKLVLFVAPNKGDTSYDGAYTVTADEPFTMQVTGGSPAKIVGGNVELKVGDADGKPRPAVTPQLHLLFPGRDTIPAGLKVLRPGYTSDAAVFTSEYLDVMRRLNPSVLRGMDWQRTNGSAVVKWEDAGHSSDFRYGVEKRGGPIEDLVLLCNLLNCDLWVNVPHMADDSFVRTLATYCRQNLNLGLNCWVEYTNECVWNTAESIGIQSEWVKQQGDAAAAANDPRFHPTNRTIRGRQWYGMRAAQIGAIFRDVFGVVGQEDRARLVLAGQASYPEMLEWSAEWIEQNVGPLRDNVFGVAVAPYFGSAIAGATVEDYLASGPDGHSRLELSVLSVLNGEKLTRFFAYARAKGVKALAYEWTNDTASKTNPGLSAAINSDPRCAPAFKLWADTWAANGGDVAMHFVPVGNWTEKTSRGAVRSLAEWSPKAQAIADASAARPQPNYVPPDPRLVTTRLLLKATAVERDALVAQRERARAKASSLAEELK